MFEVDPYRARVSAEHESEASASEIHFQKVCPSSHPTDRPTVVPRIMAELVEGMKKGFDFV